MRRRLEPRPLAAGALPVLALLLVLFVVAGEAKADIKSTTGTINFILGSSNVAVLNANGLGLGVASPSANLHVAGNAYVSGRLGIGATCGNSTLDITGSWGFSVQSVSSNTTLSGNTVVLAGNSSGNITLTLPAAGSVTGREYTIKKTSSSSTVTVSSSSLIDASYNWSLGSGNLGLMNVISNGSQWYVLSSLYTEQGASLPASGNICNWWDASDSSRFSLSGNQITQWNDISGGGNHLVYGGNAYATLWPSYVNGLSAVRFAGEDTDGDPNNLNTKEDALVCNGKNYNSAKTLFCVLKVNRNPGGLTTIMSSEANMNFRLTGAAGTSTFSGNSAGNGNDNDFTWYTDAASSGELRVNGIKTNSFTFSQFMVVSADRGNSQTGPSPICIGGLPYSSQIWRNFDGYIGEIIMYNFFLTDDQVTQAESYLRAKWGTP